MIKIKWLDRVEWEHNQACIEDDFWGDKLGTKMRLWAASKAMRLFRGKSCKSFWVNYGLLFSYWCHLQFARAYNWVRFGVTIRD